MDKSLDEIIASKPKTGRRGGPGAARRRSSTGKAQILGKAAPTPVQKARATVPATKPAATQAQPADKIIVSNLPADVNEAQIKDLFSSTIGPLRDVTLHYDATGKSKGVASVLFKNKGDGNKAYQQYNNRLIDGKRPMKIEIVVDPARPLPLASRVAPAAPAAAANGAPQRTGGGPVRRRRGRGAGPRKNDRPAKSAADLDAEMEDYTSSATAPAATAAAT